MKKSAATRKSEIIAVPKEVDAGAKRHDVDSAGSGGSEQMYDRWTAKLRRDRQVSDARS